MAAIEYRGANAVTNFGVSHYTDRLKKKGIFILDQNQDPLIPNSSPETEVEQPQPQTQPEEQPQPTSLPQQEEIVSLQYTQQLPSCMDTTTCAMADEHELTWSFFLDSTVGLTLPLPVPDIPFGELLLPDLFDDAGFEDNIDFMFDTELEVSGNEGSKKYTECVLDRTSCGVTGNMEEEEEDNGTSNSSSSPSSSTTTSVSCNYCV